MKIKDILSEAPLDAVGTGVGTAAGKTAYTVGKGVGKVAGAVEPRVGGIWQGMKRYAGVDREGPEKATAVSKQSLDKGADQAFRKIVKNMALNSLDLQSLQRVYPMKSVPNGASKDIINAVIGKTIENKPLEQSEILEIKKMLGV